MIPLLQPAAIEQVSPELAIDFVSATLDPRITFTRSGNTATVTNISGYVVPINADLPRFDYDPLTLACKGLLVEQLRTNLLIRSEEFNLTWSGIRISTSANAATSPGNTLTADKLIPNTDNNTHRLTQTATTSAGSWTFSIYLKKDEYTGAQIRITDGTSTVSNANSRTDINLLNGQLSATAFGGPNATAGSARVVAVGNDWYRVEVSITVTSGAGNLQGHIYPQSSVGTLTFAGDGTSGILAWGAQIEAGERSTSYIPTTSATQTRNPDIAVMTGTDFSDWYNQSKGTFRVDVISTANGNRPIISADDNTANESLIIKTQGNVPTFEVVDGGSPQASVTAGTVTADATAFAYVSYDTNYFGIARPTARQVDTSGTVPTPDRLRIGADQAGNYFNGHVQTIEFWP